MHTTYLSLWRPAVLALVVGAGTLAASGQIATNTNSRSSSSFAPQRVDYSTFQPITDRNIFNPRRYGTTSGSRVRQPITRNPRGNYFNLVGTMSYEQGTFAFFDGPSAAYRKTLCLNESIEGYKVTAIDDTAVKLVAGTNEVALRVGMQMRRDESGGWRKFVSDAAPMLPPLSASGRPLVVRTTEGDDAAPAMDDGESQPITAAQPTMVDSATLPTAPDAPAAEEATDNNNSAAADAAPSTTRDPILERLMQRREQEMNR